MNTTGKIISELRIKKGYTKKQLADMLKVEPIKISDYEDGKSFPDKNMTMKLKKILE